MRSLRHACIFCTSNPEGIQPILLRMLWQVIRYLSESSFLSFSNSPNLLSDTPSVAFHCSKFSVVPRFFSLLSIWVQQFVGGPLTCTRNSLTHFHFCSLYEHHTASQQLTKIISTLIFCCLIFSFHHNSIRKGTIFSKTRLVVVILFFLTMFHYNPFFRARYNKIAGYEIRINKWS